MYVTFQSLPENTMGLFSPSLLRCHSTFEWQQLVYGCIALGLFSLEFPIATPLAKDSSKAMQTMQRVKY